MLAVKPRYFRPMRNHVFGWEIYSWKHFFINIAVKTFEIQINKYPQPLSKENS